MGTEGVGGGCGVRRWVWGGGSGLGGMCGCEKVGVGMERWM